MFDKFNSHVKGKMYIYLYQSLALTGFAKFLFQQPNDTLT